MLNLSELLDRWSSVKNTTALFNIFAEEVGGFGYAYVAYAGLHSRSLVDRKVLEKNFPESWLGRYEDRGYASVDPVVGGLLRKQSRFTWREIQNVWTLTVEQKRVMDESCAGGLHDGLSVPLHAPNSEAYGISLARNTQSKVDQREEEICSVLSYHFHNVYSSLASERRGETRSSFLTEREQEVLSWCAEGKSNWAIGEILGISEHSVKFHVRNVYRKLDANSRIAAVVKAIRMGLIQP